MVRVDHEPPYHVGLQGYMTKNKPISPEDLREIHEASADWDTPTCYVEALLADRNWHRARITGDESDIERTEVTLAQVLVYAKHHGVSGGPFSIVPVNSLEPLPGYLLLMIQILADDRKLCFLDVLDEIMSKEISRRPSTLTTGQEGAGMVRVETST